MVTGPSKKCQEYTTEIGSDKKVEVIPNPVELDAFSPQTSTPEQREEIRKTFGIPLDATVACFVGRLGQEKSVDVLLKFWAEEMKKEDNMYLLIVGDGPEKPKLEELAKELHITDTVIFTGKVMHPELPPYIHTCDIYVTASLSDTNSISMLEGMAGGLPVLQLYDELNADQVRDGVNGICSEMQKRWERACARSAIWIRMSWTSSKPPLSSRLKTPVPKHWQTTSRPSIIRFTKPFRQKNPRSCTCPGFCPRMGSVINSILKHPIR